MKEKLNIVDFHSHILPGADHGSDSVETSLWQLNCALDYGVDRIIATPHFYPHKHNLDSFVKRRDEAFMCLREKMPKDISIRLGAEAFICPGFEKLPDIEKLFISGTNTLLLELPFDEFETCYIDTVQSLKSRGIDVVIAHADRYDTKVVEYMLRAGAKLQLNSTSLVGLFRRKEAIKWIKDKQVIALGSDIHGHGLRYYKSFSQSLQRLGHHMEYIKSESDKIWERSK